jgi:ERCC4-related helicase
MVLDTSKAEFIKQRFDGNKIGIFYVFKAELEVLRQVFGKENLTSDIDKFNSGDFNVIALQTVSGREGISLKNADYLVFYNIMHSAVSYWQARDRMTTIDRLNNKIYWIFSEGGIEDKIYKVVRSKKKYTSNIFKKDYKL